MLIRPYRSADCPALAELFYETVHTVCARDYTPEQLDAWATGEVDLSAWDASFLAHRTLAAVEGETIVGFADMDGSGYLDRLYVHRDFQRRGVASALMDHVETLARQAGLGCVLLNSGVRREDAHAFYQSRGYCRDSWCFDKTL